MNLSDTYKENDLLDLLYPYIEDPNDPERNWALAVYYHGIGQTASAVSFYIRCAERTDDRLLKYECLVRASMCFESQGSRGLSTWGMLKHAIALFPTRPEAYLKLSKHIEATGDEDAKNIFRDLLDNYDLDDHYRKVTIDNYERIAGMSGNRWQEFNWGPAAQNEWFKEIVEREVFHNNVYQKFVDVKPGDVVVDMGASCGPFTYRIKDQNPSRVYCFEPHLPLYDTLKKNTSYPGVFHINKAIGDKNGIEIQRGLFNENFVETQEEANAKPVRTMRWDSFVEDNNIKRINFFKIDCEGGEYSVFNDENMQWVKDNVDYIVGEWHLTDPNLEAKFRHFRDTYLKEFPNHEVYSFDEVDIKHDLWTDWFIDYYRTITIYIDNRKTTPNQQHVEKFVDAKGLSAPEAPAVIATDYTAEPWKASIAPTMEITTIIPEKGCVVDCVFCPQRTLTKVYTGERRMSLDDYKRAVDKIPQDVRITFAGFVEPWMHSECTEMVLYAHDTGHPVSIFTTGVGMSIEDIERIKHIPFAGAPNGNFTLHLPDQERKAKHPITKKYVEFIEHMGKIQHEIQNFTTMVMAGDVHEDVRHVFPSAPSYNMWSRAGNLIGETILKPELLNNKFNSVFHGDVTMTCGCDERLYHNILLPNGDVSLCCMDYGLAEITGNLYEQDYVDVVPKPYSVFDLCKYCENAVRLDHPFIQKEREEYGV
jgi:FkbM family methyltransferase